MDELKIRRAIISDPHNPETDIQTALKQDPANQQLLDEMLALDEKIAAAMQDIPVPEDLEHKLILKQSIADFKQSERRRNRWSVAIAASFAFASALGVSSWMYKPVNINQVAQYSLEHVYHEASYTDVINTAVNLDTVNAKLASYGAEFTNEFRKVTYATTCKLNGLDSLHLVFEGDNGKVTVFILPKTNELKGWNNFSDHKYQGLAKQYPKADIIVIGHQGEDLVNFNSQLETHTNWRI
jgi:hypothetical protein